MTAKIITVCNQKGGAGKTTLTMQLAGTLGYQGKKVFIVDSDPQGTASRWGSSSPEDSPFPAIVANFAHAGEKIHLEVKKLVPNYDYIFIDCLPSIESIVPQKALLISDLALVPIIPSPPDLWASMGIKTLIENAQILNPNLKSRLVINQHQTNTNLAKDVGDILQDFKIPTTTNLLRQRTAYRQAAAYGTTVHHLKPSPTPAITEINNLTQEILNLLHS